ncbi:MAG: DUF167 domain-containing protein [Candidatus Levybacteria bacterium]|nr:DUF167 domain-containing protein [Candidatus Levybacteria bacterium]
MQIFVSAKTRSKKSSVKQNDPTHFVVAVSEVPIGGRANDAIIEALAKYLSIKKSEVFIIKGETSTKKILSVAVAEETLNEKFLSQTPQGKLASPMIGK